MDLRRVARRVPGARALAARAPVVMTRRGRDRLLREATGDHPAGSYFSPIPSARDITRTSRRIVDLPGIDLRLDDQWALLEALSQHPVPAETTSDPRARFRLDHAHYGWADAASLYAMVSHLQPRTIVEFRSGRSTACILEAMAARSRGTQLTVLAPHPSLDELVRPAERDRVTVIDRDVQDVGTDVYRDLGSGDILFVHSPHVVKAGSDVQWLLFEVLPTLAPGVWVHFHDILPGFEYPTHWLERGWYWSEAYILRALLEGNDRYQINLWPSLLDRLDPERARRLLPAMARDAGSALWIQTR